MDHLPHINDHDAPLDLGTAPLTPYLVRQRDKVVNRGKSVGNLKIKKNARINKQCLYLVSVKFDLKSITFYLYS